MMDFTVSLYDSKIRLAEAAPIEQRTVIGLMDMSPRSVHNRFMDGCLIEDELAKALRMSDWRGVPINDVQLDDLLASLADALEVQERLQLGFDSSKDKMGLYDMKTGEWVIHEDTEPNWRLARARVLLENIGMIPPNR